MAFTQRRGRPPRHESRAPDLGTPELCFKRAHGLTQEVIDQLLAHAYITPTQHWCGLHLRWLYTVRYGAPVITSRYDGTHDRAAVGDAHSAEWRSMREAEYKLATTALKQSGGFDITMRVCVYNERPAFLSPQLRERAWQIPALATSLAKQQHLLLEGFTTLASQWRPRTSRMQ